MPLRPNPFPANSAVHAAAVRVLPAGEVIQVSPDAIVRKVADAPATMIPRVGVSDWQPAGDGTYRPIVRIHEAMVRVTDAERVTGLPYLTLRRLIIAGFVKGAQLTPGNVLIDLHSFYEHVEKCKDPEFWNKERREAYAAALNAH
jgi:hypothetical protein